MHDLNFRITRTMVIIATRVSCKTRVFTQTHRYTRVIAQRWWYEYYILSLLLLQYHDSDSCRVDCSGACSSPRRYWNRWTHSKYARLQLRLCSPRGVTRRGTALYYRPLFVWNSYRLWTRIYNCDAVQFEATFFFFSSNNTDNKRSGVPRPHIFVELNVK